jgi:hypothetical protein
MLIEELLIDDKESRFEGYEQSTRRENARRRTAREAKKTLEIEVIG